jgi:hypothetical protein
LDLQDPQRGRFSSIYKDALQEQIYLIWRFTVFPVSPKKKNVSMEKVQQEFSNKSVWKNIRGKRWWGGRYLGKDKPEDKEKIMEP